MKRIPKVLSKGFKIVKKNGFIELLINNEIIGRYNIN